MIERSRPALQPLRGFDIGVHPGGGWLGGLAAGTHYLGAIHGSQSYCGTDLMAAAGSKR